MDLSTKSAQHTNQTACKVNEEQFNVERTTRTVLLSSSNVKEYKKMPAICEHKVNIITK